jgi:hypothetical protein
MRYDSADLIDDNMLLVDVDCPRCGASCRCEEGCDDVALYDLTTLLRNLAIAGALTRADLLGADRGRNFGDGWEPNMNGWAAP